MKIAKLFVAAAGLLALAACSQPPAPPAYVEVPSMMKAGPASYTINFKSGSAHLSKSDLAIVREAAGTFQKGGTAVSVTGATDTVGKAKANKALSDRRAAAVAKALVAAGVPAGAISRAGVGETQLAVQTGNNVSEGANRRVVIDIR